MDDDIEVNVEDDMEEEDIKDNKENNKVNIKCSECGKSDHYFYCKTCNSIHFRDNFAHWTSGNLNLDDLIRNSQLEANLPWWLIEWIEYSNLENIKHVADGGFGSVYKAIWKDGPIQAWSVNKSEWQRESRKEVAVKKFLNATCVSSEFLTEVKNNLKIIIASPASFTIRIYGVTRDPQNNKYAIVTEFKKNGNLREMIKRNHSRLTWKDITNMLKGGLYCIHKEGYQHKDLHNGNILYSNNIKPVISDSGLCCPVGQNSADKTLYGVLPFVAPEVLLNRKFTKAADIYGIGILMSELISGEAPFADRDYDENLALDICYGQRPKIPEYAPEPFVTLMKRCWDPIPTNRPTAWESREQFLDWNYTLSGLISNDKDKQLRQLAMKQEIEQAFSQEREDKWKAQLTKLVANPRPLKKSQNLLTSKRLNYSNYLSQCISQQFNIDDWNKIK